MYGLLKHYRDELSWFDEEAQCQYVVLSTKDVQVILERHWRKQIAQEIEDYRVDRCRCGSSMNPDCEALIEATNIVERGKK
jgi:hypothetical protein